MKRVLLVLLIIAAGCRAEWRRVGAGVEFRRVTRPPIDAFVARVDLRNAKIRVIASNEDDRGLTVSEFAKKHHAILAINGDYFDEKNIHPIGLAMGACGVWTEGIDVGRRQGLVGVGKKKAEIQANTMKPRTWMSGAVSGWPLINTNCHPVEKLPGSDHFTRAPHPRTAVGLSKNGRTMYFVVADGRGESGSGLTLPELAQFMDELGACVAMNLDGGGSSAMWLEDKIINKPSDGTERKVGDHLAVVPASEYSGCAAKAESKAESEKR